MIFPISTPQFQFYRFQLAQFRLVAKMFLKNLAPSWRKTKYLISLFVFGFILTETERIYGQDKYFRKTLSPQMEVFEEVSVITELRSRPKTLNPGVPDEKLYSQKEYMVITHTLYLQKQNSDKEELWCYRTEFPKGEKLIFSYPISIADVIVQSQVASVIYSVSNLTIYAVFIEKTSKTTKVWTTVSDDILKPQSEVEPIIHTSFLPKENKPTIQLKIFKRREKKMHFLVEIYKLQENDSCRRWKKIRTFKEPLPENH